MKLKNKNTMEESSIQGAFLKLVISLLLAFLIAEASAVDVQAQGKAIVTGTVLDENGVPISGANITLLAFDHYRSFVKRVKTDSLGRFYASVNKEGSYLIYVTYDRKETPGMDYVPERWRTWLSLNSISSRQFILKKAASIYLDGEIRYIKTNKVAISYLFTVLELKGTAEKDYWTGSVRDYGSFSDLVRFVGFDERLVVVPAETEVKIQVRAYFPGKQSQTFILTGKTGYFKLSQGETLRIDVREHNIISNIEHVKGILSSGFSLLDDCRTAGFLVETERRDLLNAYSAVRESMILLRKGFFDQSFAKVRSAYILATKAENTLTGLIQSSSQTLLPSLFLFVFIASASAYLMSERSSCLEITAGNGKIRISITSLVDMLFYALLVTLFYWVFPGCRLTPQSSFIAMATFTFLVGKAVSLLFSRFAHEEKGGNRPIQFKSAIAVAFSMASRNLRRRKMRTVINLISVMILVFGFITLTSISPGYGLLVKELRPVLPVDALLIRNEPLGGYVGSFIALPDSFVEWLESNPNVTLVSPKAENSPVSFDSPLGYLYSSSGGRMTVLGVIGIIPSKEANFTGLDRIVNEGNYLEDDDPKGILISSSLKESLKVEVGDKLYGFGQEFIIRGFFDGDALSKIADINGLDFLPRYYPMSAPEPLPCPSSRVIIVNYEKALTLPKVSTSRVAVQLSDIEYYESLARTITLIYEYKVYVSHPGSLIEHSLREYMEERGIGLIPLLIVLVMLNMGLSMFATVNERRNEIANLSSVGLNPTHIASLFVAEALIIGFIGGGFGYLLGISGYRLASLIGGLQVQEKVSAEWGLLSIFLSGLTAIFASLIPALRSSTLVTPSLLRKWTIGENENPIRADKPWVLDLPIKLTARELEPFTAFVVKRLREDGSSIVDRINLEEEPFEKGIRRKISFEYYLPEKVGRTRNELIIQPVGKEYDLKLVCTLHGSTPHPRDLIHIAATYVRKLILEWSAATCKVVALLDPYMTRLYNLVNTYNPTVLYVISTLPDTHEKMESFRDALVLRGIRPPMFDISHVDPKDLEHVMKTIKELVSKADVICVSGEHATLCAALAIEAVKQNKIICYVIDNRPIEERMRNPFQDLKIVSLS